MCWWRLTGPGSAEFHGALPREAPAASLSALDRPPKGAAVPAALPCWLHCTRAVPFVSPGGCGSSASSSAAYLPALFPLLPHSPIFPPLSSPLLSPHFFPPTDVLGSQDVLVPPECWGQSWIPEQE